MTEMLAPPVRISAGRDYRVDFWRGVALAMIFINHIPGNVFENYTSRNFGFSDAAELFVLLAGFASAFAYAPLFFAGHRLVASIKAWRRAGVLVLVHILLSTMAFGLFAWAALAFGEGELMKHSGLNLALSHPLETMVGVATLGHQLGYVNILPMYSVMLLMLPIHLALAAIDRRVMLGAAIAFWIVTFVFRLDVPAYPLPGGWFFNPFAWQLIFAIGLYCGLTRKAKGTAVPYSKIVYGLCLAYAFVAFVTIRFDLWYVWGQLPFPVLISGFDKTYVSLPRLLHVLAVCYIFANAPKTSPFAAMSKDNPFVMLGRHSLPVFAVGTMLSLIGQVIEYGRAPSFLFDLALVTAGLAIQFALARYLDWWRMAAKVAVTSRDPIAAGADGAMATPSPEPLSGETTSPNETNARTSHETGRPGAASLATVVPLTRSATRASRS